MSSAAVIQIGLITQTHDHPIRPQSFSTIKEIVISPTHHDPIFVGSLLLLISVKILSIGFQNIFRTDFRRRSILRHLIDDFFPFGSFFK